MEPPFTARAAGPSGPRGASALDPLTLASDRAAGDQQADPATATLQADPATATRQADPATATRQADALKEHRTGSLRLGTLRSYLLVLVLVALGGLALFWSSQRFEQFESTAARKLQGSEQRILQLEAQNRVLHDELREIGARASVLEAKLNESLGQQAQLEQLYKAMAVESAETLLHELERGVLLALQQLQFGGAGASIAALNEFENRLGRLREPSLAAVQRALQRDLERLRADTLHDPVQVAQKLDSLLAQLDGLRLLSEDRQASDLGQGPRADGAPAGPALEGAGPGKPDGASGTNSRRAERGVSEVGMFTAERVSSLLGDLARTAQQLGAGALAAVRDLFRVTRVDKPEALLMAPEQAYFLREQLRMHLMSAKLAAMWRNDTLFKTDTSRSIELLTRFFDPQQRLVRTQIETLRQLQSMKLSLDQQALAESLAAIRNARNLREARMGR
jgi:uncharacterized protein HemX